jgi:hypothetical protein
VLRCEVDYDMPTLKERKDGASCERDAWELGLLL